MFKNYKCVTLIALGLMIGSGSAQADCISKAQSVKDRYDAVFKIETPGHESKRLAFEFAWALTFSATYPVSIFAQAIPILDYRSLSTFITLLTEAESGNGPNLSAFVKDLQSSRPDLNEEQVASMLRQANEKELICNPSYVSAAMLRSFIVEGDLELAIQGRYHPSENGMNNGEDAQRPVLPVAIREKL